MCSSESSRTKKITAAATAPSTIISSKPAASIAIKPAMTVTKVTKPNCTPRSTEETMSVAAAEESSTVTPPQQVPLMRPEASKAHFPDPVVKKAVRPQPQQEATVLSLPSKESSIFSSKEIEIRSSVPSSIAPTTNGTVTNPNSTPMLSSDDLDRQLAHQLPGNLRPELTISYKSSHSQEPPSSTAVTITPTKQDSTKKTFPLTTETNIVTSRDSVQISSTSNNTTTKCDSHRNSSTPIDATKKHSPISIKSVSSINKMDDIKASATISVKTTENKLKINDKPSTEQKNKNTSKAAQIIDLSSDEEKPSQNGTSKQHIFKPDNTSNVGYKSQFKDSSDNVSTPLISPKHSSVVSSHATFVTTNVNAPSSNTPADLCSSSLTAREPTVNYSTASSVSVHDHRPAVATKLPATSPTTTTTSHSSKNSAVTSSRTANNSFTESNKAASYTPSPVMSSDCIASSMKLQEEIDDVMNELLQISKQKQQNSPTRPKSREEVVKPDSQHNTKSTEKSEYAFRGVNSI